MEQLQDACKQGEQLMVPPEDVSQEMLQILAANSYYKIVSEEEEDEEAHTAIYFAQIRTPEDLQSLRSVCESGKDCFLPSHLDTAEATQILKKFNYAIATETRAEPVLESAEERDQIGVGCYYIQLFSQRFSFPSAPKIGAALRVAEYKEFNERTQRVLEVRNLNSQTAVFQLVFQVSGIEGRKAPGIRVQITALNVGVINKDFCNGNNGKFGFYPDQIKITIRPAWKGASVGVERVPDESLGIKSMSVASSTRSSDQFQIGVGVSKVGVQYTRTLQEVDELKCTTVAPCFDEHGGACFVWKIVRLTSGESYNFEKPFKSLMNTKSWSKLPLNGSGVKVPVSEMNRIEWPLPSSSASSSQELYLDVSVETRMVFLKKYGPIIKPVLVNLPYSARLKLEEIVEIGEGSGSVIEEPSII